MLQSEACMHTHTYLATTTKILVCKGPMSRGKSFREKINGLAFSYAGRDEKLTM